MKKYTVYDLKNDPNLVIVVKNIEEDKRYMELVGGSLEEDGRRYPIGRRLGRYGDVSMYRRIRDYTVINLGEIELVSVKFKLPKIYE